MKNRFKYCWSVAYRNAAYFRSHTFKVRDDREFIKQAFEDQDEKTLMFMEAFYKELLKNRDSEKCISSKFQKRLAPLEEADRPQNRKKIKLEE